MLRRSRPRVIAGCVEAAHAVLDLRDRHPNAHVAAMLDDAGYVLDFEPFTFAEASADDAMGWAHCMLLNIPAVRRIVLLSAVDRPLARLTDDHLAFFRRARGYCDAAGVELVDWMLTDGERIRSLSCEVDREPWGVSLPVDPEEESGAA